MRHWTASVRHNNLLPLLDSSQELAQVRFQLCNPHLYHFGCDLPHMTTIVTLTTYLSIHLPAGGPATIELCHSDA
jgi:hypothetical protein